MGRFPGVFLEEIELLIVDGYNVLARFPDLQGGDLESARNELIEQLAGYASLRGYRVVVVFDGGGGAGAPEQQTVAGVQVLYSRGPGGADQLIERLAAEQAGNVTVVTADYAQQKVVFRPGVARKPPAELLRELGELRGIGKGSGSARVRYPLGERLNEALQDELKRQIDPKKADKS